MNRGEDKPCAVAGFISYRYPSKYSGYIMIGASSDEDALSEANRSLEQEDATIEFLEVWVEEEHRYCAVRKVAGMRQITKDDMLAVAKVLGLTVSARETSVKLAELVLERARKVVAERDAAIGQLDAKAAEKIGRVSYER